MDKAELQERIDHIAGDDIRLMFNEWNAMKRFLALAKMTAKNSTEAVEFYDKILQTELRMRALQSAVKSLQSDMKGL